MSKRETVLQALFDVIEAGTTATVLRNAVLPERIPADGLVIVRDGAPGEPEYTLSPMTWHYEHAAEVEVFVQHGTDRDALFDTLCSAIGTAIAADRKLGGECDWAEAQGPEPSDLPVDGAAAIKCATIVVVLHYATTDPLN